MLVNLPNEIIIDIAKKLTFRDKFNFALACCHLHKVVSQTCLYEKMVVLRDEDLDVIVARFGNNPVLGSQVEHLELETSSLSTAFFKRLPVIFPGVSRFIDISPIVTFKEFNSLKSLLGWKDTLLHYEYTDDFYGLARLLVSHVFSNLHTLAMRSASFDFDAGGPTLFVKTLDCLKNAPSLKVLELHSCQISLLRLEEIHAASPLLESLKLSMAFIDIHEIVLPSRIEPTRQFLCFQVDNDSILRDTNCVFFKYLIAKYPHIEILKFRPKIVDIYWRNTNQNHEINNDGNLHEEFTVEVLEIETGPSSKAYKDQRSQLILRLPSSLKRLELYN